MTAAEFAAARATLAMTQRVFAEALGIHRPRVSEYEHGRRRVPRPIAKLVAMLLERAQKQGDMK